MDIASLRKMRNNDFSKITKAVESIASGGRQEKSEDDRFWKLTPDKAGNASATIRFLPTVEGDELPWVKIIDHGFQGPTGKWYIEKSLATIGLEDPVSELNQSLWNNGTDAGKDQARKQKRRTAYYANVLVVSDPANPANNGTVRLFKFGKKIMDKIMDKARPTFEDEDPVNVFDFWEGAEFKLRMKRVEGYPNYDASVFGSVTELGDDDEIVRVAKAQHPLREFLDPKNFKTYDELKRKLESVIGASAASVSAIEEETEDLPMAAPKPVGRVVEAKAPAAPVAKDDVPFDTEDDDADYFRRLAEED